MNDLLEQERNLKKKVTLLIAKLISLHDYIIFIPVLSPGRNKEKRLMDDRQRKTAPSPTSGEPQESHMGSGKILHCSLQKIKAS